MSSLSMKYVSDDTDSEGNSFPCLYVMYDGDKESKKIIHDDMPRIIGLDNEVEVLGVEDQLGRLGRMQLTESFLQPYVAFQSETLCLWDSTTPAGIDPEQPDVEIPLSMLESGWMKFPVTRYKKHACN